MVLTVVPRVVINEMRETNNNNEATMDTLLEGYQNEAGSVNALPPAGKAEMLKEANEEGTSGGMGWVKEVEGLAKELAAAKKKNKVLKGEIEELTSELNKSKEWKKTAKVYITSRDALTSELLMLIGKSKPEIRQEVSPGLNLCSFCFHPSAKEQGGGYCPCRKVGYCSTACQMLDWKRRHKFCCSVGFRGKKISRTKDLDLYNPMHFENLMKDCSSEENDEGFDEEPPPLEEDYCVVEACLEQVD